MSENGCSTSVPATCGYNSFALNMLWEYCTEKVHVGTLFWGYARVGGGCTIVLGAKVQWLVIYSMHHPCRVLVDNGCSSVPVARFGQVSYIYIDISHIIIYI